MHPTSCSKTNLSQILIYKRTSKRQKVGAEKIAQRFYQLKIEVTAIFEKADEIINQLRNENLDLISDSSFRKFTRELSNMEDLVSNNKIYINYLLDHFTGNSNELDNIHDQLKFVIDLLHWEIRMKNLLKDFCNKYILKKVNKIDINFYKGR